MHDTNRNNDVVALLTFHRALNYGAVLQAYALQKVIGDLGLCAIVLDYNSEYLYRFNHWPYGSARKLVGHILRKPWLQNKRRRFDEFRRCRLSLSEPLEREDLKSYAHKYSYYIVGSDQVWNPELTGMDMSFFLDFVSDDGCKIAYAASIGSRMWNDDVVIQVLPFIDRFSNISLREQSSADQLKPLINKEVRVVCDPTLLINGDAWGEISEPYAIDSPYLLVYTIGSLPDDCIKWAQKRASELDLRVVLIHDNIALKGQCINVRDAGPCEFLGLFKDASFVVTNSFHGSCFSVLFEKQFVWYRSDAEDGYVASRYNRIADLLKHLDLEDRIVSAGLEVPFDIDYAHVSSRVLGLRKESLSYLENALYKTFR